MLKKPLFLTILAPLLLLSVMAPAVVPQAAPLFADDDDDDDSDDEDGDEDDDGDDDDDDNRRREFLLDAFIHEVASDCQSVSVGMSIIYATDDGGEVDQYRVRIFDGGSTLLLHEYKAEVIRARNPVFVETGPIPAVAAPSRGLYRVEIWDWNAQDLPVGLIDQVFHQCDTGESWRIDEFTYSDDDNDEGDDGDDDGADSDEEDASTSTAHDNREILFQCLIPFSSGNSTAPQDGVVMITQFDGAENREFHIATRRVSAGQFFGEELGVACGRYIRAWYQPLGANLPPVPPEQVFFLGSQYAPDGEYGAPDRNLGVHPSEIPDPPVYTFSFPAKEDIREVGDPPVQFLGPPISEPVGGASLPIGPGQEVTSGSASGGGASGDAWH